MLDLKDELLYCGGAAFRGGWSARVGRIARQAWDFWWSYRWWPESSRSWAWGERHLLTGANLLGNAIGERAYDLGLRAGGGDTFRASAALTCHVRLLICRRENARGPGCPRTCDWWLSGRSCGGKACRLFSLCRQTSAHRWVGVAPREEGRSRGGEESSIVRENRTIQPHCNTPRVGSQ